VKEEAHRDDRPTSRRTELLRRTGGLYGARPGPDPRGLSWCRVVVGRATPGQV